MAKWLFVLEVLGLLVAVVALSWAVTHLTTNLVVHMALGLAVSFAWLFPWGCGRFYRVFLED